MMDNLHNIGERLRKQNAMLLKLAQSNSIDGADEDSLFTEITEIAADILESDTSSIWLLDGDGDTLTCAAEHRRGDTVPGLNFSLVTHELGGFFSTIENSRIIAITDSASDPRFHAIAAAQPEFLKAKSLLCAPVRMGGKTIGVLINIWAGRHGSWHQEEEQFAASLADFTAMSMEHRQRKRAEIELHNLREQELSLLRAIPHGVVGLENRTIIFANESMNAVFGWRPDQLVGKSTRFLYRSEEDFAAIAAMFYPVLEKKSFHTEIFPCVKSDGTRITCRVSAARIGSSLTDRRIVVVYEDVTESIQASEALHMQKRFTENLLLKIEVPAFVIDKDHRVLIWNTACEHMTGLKAEDLIGTDRHWVAFYEQKRPTLADIVIDGKFDELPLLYEFYSRSIFIENSWHGEGWYDGLGGKRRYMLFDAVPIYDDRNELVAAIETLQDISKRKSAEEALRDSENRYRAIFESTGTAMIMIEEDTVISLTNTEFQRLTGYTGDEIEGKKSWTGFVSPDDLDRMKGYHVKRRSESGDAPLAYDFRLLDRNGGMREMFLTITMIPGTKKSVASLIDISHVKNAERQMERMRFYLQNIIDSMPSILIGVDRDGGITQWNRAAQEETGLPVEKALGCHLAEVLPWFSPMLDSVWAAMNGRDIQKMERIPRHSEDSLRFIDVMIYPLIWNNVEGAVVRIDDVTKRVRIDEMMIQTEKMISVGGLAAGMAHEINNPLSGILMSVENIIRRVTPGLPKNLDVAARCGVDFKLINEYMEKRELYKMLDSIREMGLRAAMIVSNMLNFSRQSSSRPSPINLNELLDKTLGLAEHDYDLKKKYDFRHIDIVKDYSDVRVEAMCIATEIEQVLLNLLRNAAQEMMHKDYTGDRPRITLRLMDEGTSARIEVEDNGPGMDESVRKRIFEPFFTTREPGAGTGLGLSISYFIITNNHKGTLSVESEPGRGAKFIVEIPRVESS